MSTVLLKQDSSSKGDLLKIGAAAQLLFVSEQTLRDWTEQDKITAYVTDGGHRFYHEADVRRLSYENRQVSKFYHLTGIVTISPDKEATFEANVGDTKYSDLTEVEWGKYWDYKNGLGKQTHLLALKGEPVFVANEEVNSDGDENICVGVSIVALTQAETLQTVPIVVKSVKDKVLTKYSPKQVTRWFLNGSNKEVVYN